MRGVSFSMFSLLRRRARGGLRGMALTSRSRDNSKQSAVDIPSYVVEHPDELRYLLPGPGHCIREDAPPES